jgi:MFS family permease
VVIFVAIGTISTAYGLAIIGSTVGQPNFYSYFNLAVAGEPGYDHTTNMIGALNGVNSAGAIAGCLSQAWSADKYGRKRTMQIGSVILIVGGALCAGAVDMAMFLVGRFIAGMGSGVLACVVPIYQAEVSTPGKCYHHFHGFVFLSGHLPFVFLASETRGAMVCVTGIMYAVGYMLAGWLGFACFHMSANDPAAQFAWRFPLAFQVVFPIILLAGSKIVPFSPRWLLSKGRRQEALDVVKRLHATAGDTEHVVARREFWLMEKQYEMDASMTRKHGQFAELFSTPANRKRTLMACLLMWGDQFLGIFVMTNYVSSTSDQVIQQLTIAKGRLDLCKPRTERRRTSPAQCLLDHLYPDREHLDGIVHRSLRPPALHAHRVHRLCGVCDFLMCTHSFLPQHGQ